MTGGRRLIVMRHAKAEPYAANDHVRELTDRGVASARDVGRYLRDQGLSPEYVAVSSSTRTRQTWAAVSDALDVSGCEVSFDDALFTGSADVVVESLHATPAHVGTVMFVGHNPTAAYMCHYLDDGGGDATAVSSLLRGFPPSAVAVLEISVPWADLASETGSIVGYYVGKG